MSIVANQEVTGFSAYFGVEGDLPMTRRSASLEATMNRGYLPLVSHK
jgi:hypothetical protein